MINVPLGNWTGDMEQLVSGGDLGGEPDYFCQEKHEKGHKFVRGVAGGETKTNVLLVCK